MAAAVGVVTFELAIEHAQSLKDKRQVVKSLKDRLRSRFNVAVAEIEYQDVWQRSVVAVVTVSSDRKSAEAALQRVEADAAEVLGGMLVGVGVEWL
jgi:uncharacterized protein YlxP (DUF503 family)